MYVLASYSDDMKFLHKHTTCYMHLHNDTHIMPIILRMQCSVREVCMMP